MNKFFIEYYTDPLCCWSWGMEPQMRKLRFLLKDRLNVKYIMGGLIRDWNHYSDHMNDISRPSQMGPLWMEAKHITGQPMQEFLWVNDPVDSTYPACMAVKAAQRQSFIAGEAMLRELREAVMIQQKNIGEKKVILEIAEDLENKGVLDLSLFKSVWMSEEAANLFRSDLEQIKIKGISRFPTLLISYGERTIQITGYRPFSVLLDAFKNLDPHLNIDEDIDADKYKNSWVRLTDRELEEINLKERKMEAIF